MADEKVMVTYKNPSIAALLSFLFMGAGQIYNGETRKGILFIAMYAVSLVLMTFLIGFITTPILWIWGMVDASKSAKRINRALASKLSHEETPGRNETQGCDETTEPETREQITTR